MSQGGSERYWQQRGVRPVRPGVKGELERCLDRGNGFVTTAQIAARLGIECDEAGRIMRQLEDDGYVELFRVSSSGTVWRITDDRRRF